MVTQYFQQLVHDCTTTDVVAHGPEAKLKISSKCFFILILLTIDRKVIIEKGQRIVKKYMFSIYFIFQNVRWMSEIKKTKLTMSKLKYPRREREGGGRGSV